MFNPTRVEIRNIGSIPHAVIEPHPDGITALDGPTGSGKSTLMNAVAFALYGYIGGVTSFTQQKDLRFDLCPDGEPAEAAVDFTWGGATFRAVRRLRRTRSGQEKAEAELWIDGVAQPNMSPDRLTEKIVALTGMTGRAFTSAFFLPQHHLERIATGTPAEVQAVIEEQTGLTALTGQIQKARGDAHQAQLVADAMPGTQEALDAAQAAVDAAQAEAVQVFDERDRHQQVADRLTGLHASRRATLDGLLDRQHAATEARRRVDALTGRLSLLTEQVAAQEAQIAALPPMPDAATVDADRRLLTSAVDQANRASVELAHWERVAREADAALAAAQAAADQAPVEAAQATLDAAVATQRHLAARTDSLRGQYRDLIQHKNDLVASGTDQPCPTCLQPVNDPRHVLATYDRLAAQFVTDGQEAATALAAADTDLRAAQTAAETARRAADRAADARMHAADATAGAERARAAAQAAHRQVAQAGFITTDDAVARLDELAVLAASIGRADQLRHQHTASTAALTQTATELDTMKVEAGAAMVDEAELDTARAAELEVRAELQTATSDVQRSSVDAARVAAEVKSAEQVRDAEQARLDAKIAALTEADTLRFAVATLTEQRHDLLTRFTEVISEAATRVMEQAGGGRHVGVVIDGRFTPEVVLADGRRRLFRLCSGGEQLRAALCLCLGQVELVSAGDTSGTLFADEIATGYDADTTRAVMDVIATLGRPMILIGHNPEVPQIANRVYRFDNPNDQGSTVALAGAAA